MASASRLSNAVGALFFDSAKNVPASRHLSEQALNAMIGTQFSPGCYRLIALCPGRQCSLPASALDHHLTHWGQTLWERVQPLCLETISRFQYLKSHILLNYPSEKDGAILEVLTSVLDEINQCGEYPPAAICVSETYSSIQQIGQMLEETSNISWMRFVCPTGTLLFRHMEPPCPPEVLTFIQQTQRDLQWAVSTLDFPVFQKTLDDFLNRSDEIVGRHETRIMIRKVEQDMFDINHDLISAVTDADEAGQKIVTALRAATDLASYTRTYRDHLVELFSRILELSSSHLSRPIRQVERYVRQNFSQDIHLEDAARFSGLSPTYLSSRFKQETGVGFSDYVNQCRIEEAKRLLGFSSETVVNIAHQVGFSSPRYFSRVFTLHTGMKPTEYRQSRRIP